ncbi:hypothetical protein JYT83_01450, partial [bacterium AH-315-F18]|nr:hypothetical protein [bacterium AH-315-F18]
MSWDVIIQDLPNVTSASEIPDNFRPASIGRRDEIIRKILEIAPTTDFSDPSWGVLDTDHFSIEFNLGDTANVDSLACHVRGTSGGGACVAAIVKHLGLRALDMATGDFLDTESPELGFEAWRNYLAQ